MFSNKAVLFGLVLATFNTFEDKFRDNKWDKATEEMAKLESQYKKLVPQIKGTVSDDLIKKFDLHLDELKQPIAQKNGEETEKAYLKLQAVMLDIMDFYDYKTPPVLLAVNIYLDEASDDLKEGRFQVAAGEFSEIAGYEARAKKAFQEKRASAEQIEKFFQLNKQGEELAGKKDAAALKKLLGEMEEIIAPYIEKL